jgi:hypothetical protein
MVNAPFKFYFLNNIVFSLYIQQDFQDIVSLLSYKSFNPAHPDSDIFNPANLRNP